MSKRVHGYNLFRIRPRGKWANIGGWLGIGKIRLVVHIKVLAGNGKSVVDGIGASVCANGCDALVAASSIDSL